MVILGIETSCDETAAAVVRDGKEILSGVIASQVPVHSPFGGVVPELASRMHLEYIIPIIERALGEASISGADLDAIAVTQGPGLVGALLVGVSAAKAMAYALGKPLIAVNHLDGHIQAAFLADEMPREPFICLVVSGGHTALYRADAEGGSHLLGATRDDAAGEAFDKVAKILGIGYPGGVAIERLACGANAQAINFPRSRFDKDSLEFSFSGLKTAAANFVRTHGVPGSADSGPAGTVTLEDFAASFQEAVADVLVEKSILAARQCGLSNIAAVGGVAANGRLRERLAREAAAQNLRLYLPPVKFCTDNAVMIAAAAYRTWQRFGPQPGMLEIDAFSR
ncbi:MAG: tRNA (adenosine(37)-N6)-threonylcarbamoyltransferase complex transferase subunit TsaD [Syntrophobacteraceae bacterium]|nr:tRNA (adenosine(37)-N6)-threonylcarbamoyltransferase complex transferase subunit TsaD [Syntrophobacteraceae bacterium]